MLDEYILISIQTTLEGSNYLIPITGSDSPQLSIAKETFLSLDYILELVADSCIPHKVPLIVILDCCRTELIREKERQYAFIDTKRSRIDKPNTYIIYSTAGNQTAQDGTVGEHGIFTERLLEFMDSDESIEKVFKCIQTDLQHVFNGEQVCSGYRIEAR